MFRKIQDFVSVWDSESANTLKVLSAITEENKHQEVAPGFRSLERLAWHVTGSIREMGQRIGLKFSTPIEENLVPKSVGEIVSTYQALSKELVEQVSKWADADLEHQDNMYGEMWARGTTLLVLITHQAHHRGQMTVLLRQSGSKIPGIAGPSKEEWTSFGQEPPVV